MKNMARNIEVEVINPKFGNVERTTKVTDIAAVEKLAKREYQRSGNLVYVNNVSPDIAEGFTKEQLLKLVFGHYLSRHKIKLLGQIAELNLPETTFEDFETSGLVFPLADKRSYQRKD